MADMGPVDFIKEKPEFYLQHGKYTAPGKVVSEKVVECKKLFGLEKRLEYITGIIRGLGVFPDSDEKYRLRRARGAEDILASNKLTGCVDYSLILLSMVRELGIPARYVETFRQDFFDNPDKDGVSGHIFVDLFVDGEWREYNPAKGFVPSGGYHLVIPEKKNELGNQHMRWHEYVPIAKGLDFSDLRLLQDGDMRGTRIAINDFDDMRKYIGEFKTLNGLVA
ncbi:MAG: transglutaminase domain-containing protein [archaeon]